MAIVKRTVDVAIGDTTATILDVHGTVLMAEYLYNTGGVGTPTVTVIDSDGADVLNGQGVAATAGTVYMEPRDDIGGTAVSGDLTVTLDGATDTATFTFNLYMDAG